MERWERDAFQNLENDQKNLKEIWIERNEEKDGPIWYVDIRDGNLTWTSYNLILQFCRDCWTQKLPLFNHPYPPLFASSYPIVHAKHMFLPHSGPQVTKVWLIIVLFY